MKRLLLIAFAILVIAGIYYVAAGRKADIQIDSPWTNAPLQGQNMTAGYMLIMNHGKRGDALISVTTPVAEKVEIHSNEKKGPKGQEIMQMRQIDSLEIKPGHAIELAPGGYHLMIMGVKDMPVGGTIPVTLMFKESGEKQVNMQVRLRR